MPPAMPPARSRVTDNPRRFLRSGQGFISLLASALLIASATLGEAADLSRQFQTRAILQRAAVRGYTAFHDFQFTNRIDQSGITFRHQVVEDAGKHYKAVHYDHGNGVSAADIDNDGLLDIYLTSQIGPNQLLRSLGNGRFEDITARAGVALADRISVGSSFADIDNDGDPDLFVTTVRMGNALFENLGGGRFRDVTEKAGLGYIGHSSGAVFFDYDNDGLLDLFLTNVGTYTGGERGPGGYFVGLTDAFKGHRFPQRAEQSILYRNTGKGVFEDVSKAVQLQDKSWSGDASICDINEDGFPDLYVVSMQGDDRYYENQQGKRFEDRTERHFPKTPWGAMGIKFFDYNLDGRMDLFITDMHSDMTTAQTRMSSAYAGMDLEKAKSEAWCRSEFTDEELAGGANNIFGNAFYRNLGNGNFEEVSDRIGVETFWPWGMSAADLNADGYEDLFVTAGMGIGFRYAPNALLLNEGGERFFEAEYVLGAEPRLNGAFEKVAYVLACSGADRTHPYCEGRTGDLNVYESLSTRSSIILDVDQDGDLDILTNEMNDRPQLLISDLSSRRPLKYLQIKLVGTRSNRDAIGARVTVRAADRTYTRYHDGKSGYLSQSSMPLYFGLDQSTQVDQIEVTWPGGTRQTLQGGIALNGTVTIRQE